MKRTVKLDPGAVEAVEAMDYKAAGLRVLHTHALTAGVGSKRIQGLRAECLKAHTAFELGKGELAKEAGVPAGTPFTVDYREGTVSWDE